MRTVLLAPGVNPIAVKYIISSPPKRPLSVSLHRPLWYLMTPSFLLYQLLHLRGSSENIEGDHDAPDPTAEGIFQTEYFFD